MAFTFFFRDAQTLETAFDHVLPQWRGRAFIHVWDAGCAHGPETYTIAMLLRERMSDYVFRNVRIHATDVDAQFADQVRSGVFKEEETRRLPPSFLEKYFQPADAPGCVQVVGELRSRVAFQHHDLLAQRPPREDYSMIVCKNVLLHFDESQRCRVLREFYEALLPGGLLAMEHTQKVPASLADLFEPVSSCAQVYRKPVRKLERQPGELAAPHFPTIAANAGRVRENASRVYGE